MKNGDLITCTLKHWSKNDTYFICKVRQYLDHREKERFQYLAIKRVCCARHEFSKDIVMDSTWVFEPCDVSNVEPYKCDNSGIECNSCDLCFFGEDIREY